MESDEVKAAVERVRRVKAGENECMVHGVQCRDDARYLTRSDLATLGEAYLALGKLVLTESTVDDDRKWISRTFLKRCKSDKQ